MDAPLEVDLRECPKAGFEAVEINFDKAKAYLETHSMRELGALVRESGLAVATLNAIFETNFCTPGEWQRVEDEFQFACALGEAVDSHKVIVLTNDRANLREDIAEEAIDQNVIEVLEKLADMGKATGMQIGLEPVGDMLIPNIDRARRIVEKINRPEVGIVIDDFNLYLWDLLADVREIERVRPENISIVHLNDAEKIPYRKIDQMHRCMPGDGRIDVVDYMKRVKKTGYDGYVSIEILNPKIWAKGPEVVIPEAYQKGKAVFEQL